MPNLVGPPSPSSSSPCARAHIIASFLGRDFSRFSRAGFPTALQACAEQLVSAGFTTPSRMGANVNSAGGLLAGVMANTRPELFAAMVMKVRSTPVGGRVWFLISCSMYS